MKAEGSSSGDSRRNTPAVSTQYDDLIYQLELTKAPVSNSEGAEKFSIHSIVEAKTPSDLTDCGLVWLSVLNVLNEYRDFIIVKLIVVGSFGLGVEKDAHDDNETILNGFKLDPDYIRSPDLPIKLSNEYFEPEYTEELTYRRNQLESLGYLKLGRLKIPSNRIIQINFELI